MEAMRSSRFFIVMSLLLGAMWIADLIWASRLGVRMAGLGNLIATILLMAINFIFYRRLREGDRAAGLVAVFGILFALTSGSAALSYFAATVGRPYADAMLARGDAALGFDWLAWYHVVQDHRLLRGLLHGAYVVLVPEMVLFIIALPLSGMLPRAYELLSGLAISLIPTLILFALFPAECAWVVFQAEPGRMPLFLRDLVALRSGAMPVVEIGRLNGLVTFPSFHTVMAILMTYAARGTRFLFLACVVNGLMIVGCLSEGGHYLVDLIAGGVIAIGTIVVLRYLARRGSGDVGDVAHVAGDMGKLALSMKLPRDER